MEPSASPTPPRTETRLRRVLRYGTLVAAVLTPTAYALTHAAASSIRFFDNLSTLIFAWWAALGVCGLALGIFGLPNRVRHVKQVPGTAVFLAVAFHTFTFIHWWLPPEPTEGVPGYSVSLGSCNVWASGYHSPRIIRWARESDPEILVFQEVTARWNQELMPLNTAWPHRQFDPTKDLLLLSKHPIVRTDSIPFGNNRGMLICDIDIHGNMLTVAANHCCPVKAYGDAGYEARNKHLAAVGQGTPKSDHPTVLLGDFNTGPGSPYHRQLTDSGFWKDARIGFGLTPTHHHALAGMRNNILLAKPIDFALTSTNISTRSFTVGPDVGSDHRPINLTIEVH